MAFQWEKCETFFLGGKGGMAPDPLTRSRRGTGPSLAFNTIGDEGYVNSAQPPLSEIPGSAPVFKDGAYYCYCAYVLRISRYSDFLSPMLTNTGIFLRGLKLSGESRS